MFKISSLLVSFVVFSACLTVIVTAFEIDCQRPPQLVDPALCCQDGGRDSVTENCAKRLGLTGQPNDPPPTVQTATCLAECILTESRYLQQPEQLNFEIIRSDLQQKYSNDSIYIQTMFDAFKKCEPSTQRKMLPYKNLPMNGANLQRGCSPFSGMLLGCAYMEYFKNCPAHRWTENTECSIAKQFVTQCALGA